MVQLRLKFATPEDATEALQWLAATPEFDPAIVGYPTFRMLGSYNGSAVAFLPTQRVLMLESLAVKPGTDELLAAQAARDLVKGVQLIASGEGIREIYFLSTDSAIQEIAEKHGFERVVFPLMRMRL